jgi:prolyl 4-hydroxylase
MATVDKGGETYFPRALNAAGNEYKKWNYDYADCYRGIAVKAITGNAIIFYSMLPNGGLDERSMHGGCAVRVFSIYTRGCHCGFMPVLRLKRCHACDQ